MTASVSVSPLFPSAAAPRFDRLAGIYRWLEWFSFGPYLHRARTVFLGELGSARRSLVLGDGDGRFTARLLTANSSVTVDAVDASPAMLRALLHRAGPNAGRVRPLAADARQWQPESNASYDLIVTHFFLDCLTTEEIAALAGRLRLYLSANGTWLLSDFAISPGIAGWIARPLIRFLYFAFGVLTGLRVQRLPDHVRELESAGFTRCTRRTQLGGILISELWKLETGHRLSS